MNTSTNHPTSLPLVIDHPGATYAMILLRIWLGIRCLQAGIEKYAGIKLISKPTEIAGAPDTNGMETTFSQKVYSLENYKGVPESLSEKFKTEPLINDWLLSVYDVMLGPLLLITGLCVLLGLATRLSLFAMGLIYTSLTFGLILLNQASGIAWLGTHIILIALALLLAGYNRIELGNILADRAGFKWLRNK